MQQILQDSVLALQKSDIILYPTDTVWGIGCDATEEHAVLKVFQIKKRNESKSLVVLVSDIDMLKEYIEVLPVKVQEIIQQEDRPVTIIYNNPKGLAKSVVAEDNTVAIRMVNDDFCKKLIQIFGKPIVSTSANISSRPTPKQFKEIDPSILKAVDYTVNLKKDQISDSPSITINKQTSSRLCLSKLQGV